MSILGRYFAISRKPEVGFHLLIATLFSVVCGLIHVNCIVTDTIDTEDEVNQPFEIIEVVRPITAIVPACRFSNIEFVVNVWDPDVKDPNSSQMKAKLYLASIPSSPEDDFDKGFQKVPNPCITNPTPVEIDNERYQTGAITTITCDVELEDHNVYEGGWYPIKLRMSDMGYITESEVPDNARVAEVTWILMVLDLEDEQCQNSSQ
ncbi:MAG: hypothetical protein GY847_17140 [Proteobacteria bacterium]|nr:hypothetical protein [Pseudomonadota bacterium]